MSKRKKITLIIIALVLVLAAVGGGAYIVVKNNQKTVYAIDIQDVDLALVQNGTYVGEYNAFPVSAKVEVTVTDHRITAIDLIKHNNGQGGDAEVIPQMVVDAQSLQVDTVSGATFSSKVILLAIQNALQNAVGE
ncbi:MAG TPA: FMN-binding protein [Candidatus Limiplasma sp.]|nr:FMN-binding protein [Candidatus Limiplasma sp.]HRX08780.1 FMN-binding protein [Candidatus Limiplasma sp.]